MTTQPTYDCAIIGGGLAGLSMAILMANQGRQVILFEKEQYPFHKVCGEYISLESEDFLRNLGIPVREMELPFIDKLLVTAPNGNKLEQRLPLGGFGISRYKLDDMLCRIARSKGVTVVENCKVSETIFNQEQFELRTNAGSFRAKTCCGSFGKRSNLDVKWKRAFAGQAARRLNQYTGIKYHIQTDFPPDTIALHNFPDGYCGISKIEDDRYCLCYLTHSGNLKKSDQQVAVMEQQILSTNPHLKELLTKAKHLYTEPVSISQVSFLKKSQVEDHVLLLGDAAGLITPLCGNGMSMAKIAAGMVEAFLTGSISRQKMEEGYVRQWRKTFARRLWFGRIIQYFFGKAAVTNIFISVLKRLPGITRWLIKQTHGRPF
ncbi:MAG: NAD(P)/FAD-dependent oxidoreductase [Chitinophagaceae bacterium]|nr:MAG: NAD(P)/FAD-dependent oxidoreductase [Chitinophagaceae bacterium]